MSSSLASEFSCELGSKTFAPFFTGVDIVFMRTSSCCNLYAVFGETSDFFVGRLAKREGDVSSSSWVSGGVAFCETVRRLVTITGDVSASSSIFSARRTRTGEFSRLGSWTLLLNFFDVSCVTLGEALCSLLRFTPGLSFMFCGRSGMFCAEYNLTGLLDP